MNLKSTLAACTIAATCMLSVIGGSQAQTSDSTLSVQYQTCNAINEFGTCTPITNFSAAVTNTDTGERFEGTTDANGYVSFAVSAGTYEIDTIPGDALDDSHIGCVVDLGGTTYEADYPITLAVDDAGSCVYQVVPTDTQGDPAPAPTTVATVPPVASLPKTGIGATQSDNGNTDTFALIGAASALIGSIGYAVKRRGAFHA